MSSKAARRRHKKNSKERLDKIIKESVSPAAQPSGRRAVRPTEERKAHGIWATPSGAVKHQQPYVDMVPDEVARLYVQGAITSTMEQSARSFQQARASYILELPDVSGYKSCLAGSVPGYDDGEGDAHVIAAYRSLERRLRIGGYLREVIWVCAEDNPPNNLDALRAGLDLLAR